MTPHVCTRCGGKIPLFETHIAVQFVFLDKVMPEEVRRFCAGCAVDPACAVLFSDVLAQSVGEVRIRKVWG